MCRVRSVAARVGYLAIALLISSSISPPSIRAEPSDTDSTLRPPDDSMLQFLARRIPEGRTVRVVLHSGTRVFRASMFTPAGIAMARSSPGAADSVPTLLPWRDVERIDVRVGSSRRGAIVGGVALGLFGAVIGGAIASDPFFSSGGGSDIAAIAALTAIGVAGGAGAGALIGWPIPHWKHVYPPGGENAAARARSWSSRGAQRR
jgi:hypothetical protein